MKKLLFGILLSLTFLLSCYNDYSRNRVLETRNTINVATLATVAIIENRTESSDAPAQPYCSGFFISRTRIVSALHCFQDVREITVGDAIYRIFVNPNPIGNVVQFVRYGEINMITNNFETTVVHEARVIYTDRVNDIALLDIEQGTEPSNVYIHLSSRAPSIAEHVYLIGHPGGIGWTVVDGIISRIMYDNTGVPNILQSTTPLIGGFSGGPLINEHGEVIGLARAYINRMHHISVFTSSNVILTDVSVVH
jgi:S1-C subfamily serine protease